MLRGVEGNLAKVRGSRFNTGGGMGNADGGDSSTRAPISAWRIFDAKVTRLLRGEYRIREVTKVTAGTLPELAAELDGVDGEASLRTIEECNSAVRKDIPFNPNVKDGRCATGLAVPKTNWANTIEEGPFEAYGITFTFGGLRINSDAEVLDGSGAAIPGLDACGETAGAVFGRRASVGAASAKR